MNNFEFVTETFSTAAERNARFVELQARANELGITDIIRWSDVVKGANNKYHDEWYAQYQQRAYTTAATTTFPEASVTPTEQTVTG